MRQTLYFEKISPLKIWWLSRKCKKCPNCGSEKVGNGNGTFEINQNQIKRTCKCGHEMVEAKLNTQ